jgi:hypothetical protein
MTETQEALYAIMPFYEQQFAAKPAALYLWHWCCRPRLGFD